MRRPLALCRPIAALGLVLLVAVLMADGGTNLGAGTHGGPPPPAVAHSVGNRKVTPTSGPAMGEVAHPRSSGGALSVQFTLSLLNGSVVAGNQVAPGLFHPEAAACDTIQNLWFVANDEQSVSVLDPSTLQQVSQLSVPNGAGPLVVDALHERLYVGSSRVVYVFNTSSLQLVGQIALDIGYGQVAALVLDPDHGRLLVVGAYNETGILLDTGSDTVVGSVPGVRDLISGTYDPFLGEVLLGNDSDSQIAVFDAVHDHFDGTFNAGSGTTADPPWIPPASTCTPLAPGWGLPVSTFSTGP